MKWKLFIYLGFVLAFFPVGLIDALEDTKTLGQSIGTLTLFTAIGLAMAYCFTKMVGKKPARARV